MGNIELELGIVDLFREYYKVMYLRVEWMIY